eukprot:gene21216-28126_t
MNQAANGAMSLLQRPFSGRRKKSFDEGAPGESIPEEATSEASDETRKKAERARSYLENLHRERQMTLGERTARRSMLLIASGFDLKALFCSGSNMDSFEPLTIIGRGAFGEVRIVKERTTGKILAMKKLKKSEMLRRGQVEHVKAERNVLAEVHSPFVVKLFYSFQDEQYLYLAMEYLAGGDMMTLLMRKDILSEEDTRFYMAESVMGIEAIHKGSYIHRAIKTKNLPLENRGHVKLSGFGLAIKTKNLPLENRGHVKLSGFGLCKPVNVPSHIPSLHTYTPFAMPPMPPPQGHQAGQPASRQPRPYQAFRLRAVSACQYIKPNNLLLDNQGHVKLSDFGLDIKPDNLLLDNQGHVKLSDFGLLKTLNTTTFKANPPTPPDLNENLEYSDVQGLPIPSQKTQQEQLMHWQKNRRQLAFSTVGTPDYIAPEKYF